MNEQEEVNLHRFIKVWETRQTLAGTLLFFTLFPALGTLVAFFANPSRDLCIALAVEIGFLLYFCYRIMIAASRVVEIKQHLVAAQLDFKMSTDFVDVEIVK